MMGSILARRSPTGDLRPRRESLHGLAFLIVVALTTVAFGTFACASATITSRSTKKPTCSITALQATYEQILERHEERVKNRTALALASAVLSPTPAFAVKVTEVGGFVSETNLLTGMWPGFDIRTGQLTYLNPLSTAQTSTLSHSSGVYSFAFQSSSQAVSDSLSASVSVGGGGFGFHLSASASYATQASSSSMSSSVTVYMLQIMQVESAQYSDAALSSYALLLANTDSQGFLDTYGTHAVVSKTRGCYATMTATYTFSSASAKQFFDASAAASVGFGAFSASVAASFDSAASSAESVYTLQVNVQGDAVTDAISAVGDSMKLADWASSFGDSGAWASSCAKLSPAPVRQIGVRGWSAFQQMSLLGVTPSLAVYGAADWNSLAQPMTRANLLASGLAAAVAFVTKMTGDADPNPVQFTASPSVSVCSAPFEVAIEGPTAVNFSAMQEGFTAVEQAFEDVYSFDGVGSQSDLSELATSFSKTIGDLWSQYNRILLASTTEWTFELSATIKTSGNAKVGSLLQPLLSFTSTRKFNTLTEFQSTSEAGIVLGGLQETPQWYECGGIGPVTCSAPDNSIGVSIFFGGVSDTAATVRLRGSRASEDTTTDCPSNFNECSELWWRPPSTAGLAGCRWIPSLLSYSNYNANNIWQLQRGVPSSVTVRILPCSVSALHSENAGAPYLYIDIEIKSTPTVWGACESED